MSVHENQDFILSLQTDVQNLESGLGATDEEINKLKKKFDTFAVYWLKNQSNLIDRLNKAEAKIETLKRRD